MLAVGIGIGVRAASRHPRSWSSPRSTRAFRSGAGRRRRRASPWWRSMRPRSTTSVTPSCRHASRSRAGTTRGVIDHLHRAGARVIAIDIQFTEPTDPYRRQRADQRDRARPARHARRRPTSATADDVLGGNANLRRRRRARRRHGLNPDSDGSSAACATRSGPADVRRVVADASGRPVAAARVRRPRPRRSTSTVRPGTIPTSRFSASTRHVRPALVPRQDRVRRRHGAVAPGPPRVCDHRHDGRARDPGQRRPATVIRRRSAARRCGLGRPSC